MLTLESKKLLQLEETISNLVKMTGQSFELMAKVHGQSVDDRQALWERLVAIELGLTNLQDRLTDVERQINCIWPRSEGML